MNHTFIASPKKNLDEAIAVLQIKQTQQFKALRDQFYLTYESLKPINLIKSTWQEVASSSEIKSNLLNSMIGLAAGYLSKKVLFGASHNPVKKVLGMLLEFGIANITSRNADAVKSAGGKILHGILKNRAEKKQETIEL